MPAVAITGATSGIGLEIKKYFLKKNYLIQEFNSSNNFDIAKKSAAIVSLITNCDIFVNNAYSHEQNNPQLVLLKQVVDSWEGQSKTIINISSRYITDDNLYCKNKKELDQYCMDRIYTTRPNIINLKPGLVNTERVKNIAGPRLETSEIVDIIDYILTNNIMIQSITFGR